MLPKGQREHDPDDFLFRLLLIVRRHPIVAAFTVAIVLLALPMFLVVVQQGQLRLTQSDLHDAQRTLQVQVRETERQASALEKQDQKIQNQRGEAVALVCDMNAVLREFIEAEPDYPRDIPALEALRAERCDDLLGEIESETGAEYEQKGRP